MLSIADIIGKISVENGHSADDPKTNFYEALEM